MTGIKSKKRLFIFWIVLALVSTIWLILNLIINSGSMFSTLSSITMFLLVCLSLMISVLSILNLFSDTKEIIKEDTSKQKNIRDFYIYYQLLEPPEMNN